MGLLRGTLAIAVVVLAACGDNIHLGGGTLVVSPQAELRTSEGGGTAMFTVALANEPLRDITVDLISLDLDEGTVSPATLTIRATDYDQPRTITIAGVDDDHADGDQAYLVRVEGPGVGAVDVDVTNMDDDTASIAVSPLIGLMTSEGGMTAQFEVNLTSKPLADVTIPLASSNANEGMPDLTSLTFTDDNWATPQVVTVTGLQDLVADGSVTYSIMLGVTASTDTAYDGLDPDDVTLLNVDDDVQGIAVSGPASLTTTESGTQDTFLVVLQTQPTADVTIAVGSTAGTEASVSPAQLVFTPADWDQPQTVTATGEDDFIDDGDQPFTIELASATSSDPIYDGLDASDVPGVNSDDDTAGIVVSPTSGLVTSEGGASDTFTVVLTSEPTSAVAIDVSSSDTTEGAASPAALTFTAADWDQPQTVTVTGVDDAASDGDQPYTVVLAPATSSDTVYAGIDPDDVAATNTDDDFANIIVSPTSGLVVSEAGTTATFTIVLDTAPTANVTINLTSSDTTEGTVQPASVTFTPMNWSTPRTITVTGVDDAIIDADQVFQIVTSPATSVDARYNGLDPDDVQVTNLNNDHADVIVQSPPFLLVSENGTSATFRVRLSNAPTAPVTCTLQSADASEGTVNPTTLTFTPGQFGFQTVTVTGVDDNLNDGPVLFVIQLNACTSADPQYNGANPRDVPVLNWDND